MRYTINEWTLDVTSRQLTNGTNRHHIRPRTLALLLYLIEHQSDVVSKERLLTDVWHDVAVNEGVVFQSIREIRQCLGDSASIVNHPRQGYQLVAQVSLTDQHPTVNEATNERSRSVKRLIWAAAVVIVTAAIWLLPAPQKLDITVTSASSNGNLNEDVERLKQSLYANEGFIAFTSVNAIDWVELSVLGEPTTVDLVYRTTSNERQLNGIVFDVAWRDAAQTLFADIQQQLLDVGSLLQPLPARWDPDVIDAFVAYQTDWEMSIQLLEPLLQRYPENSRIAFTLAELYLWDGQWQRAKQLLAQIDEDLPEWSSKFAYLRAKLHAKQNHPEVALELLAELRRNVVMEVAWEMLAKVSELEGDIHYQLGDNAAALAAFQRSASLFAREQNWVGLADTKLKMTVLYIATQQVMLARQHFAQAHALIEQQHLSFLYARYTEILDAHRMLLAAE